MKNSIKKPISKLMIGIALVLISQYGIIPHTASESLPPSLRQNTPDYWMEGMSSITMDANGQIKYRLQASRMEHFQDGRKTTLTQPDITFYPNQKQLWRVSSQQGLSDGDFEQITLRGQVKVVREESADAKGMSLFTSYLNVFPQKQTVETDAEVNIIGHGYTAQAFGLQADIQTGKVKLLSKVRARYEKNS